MPNSVERALADALSLEHPDVPWTPPPRLPSASELRSAIEILTPRQATPKHATWCISKLMLAFGTRLDAETAKLQAAVWIEACGDLDDELWSKATMALIRGWRRDEHYGRAPEPSDFREAVSTEIVVRAKKLDRCRRMLAAQAPDVATAKPFQPESDVDRLKGSIARWRKFGDRAMGMNLRAKAVAAELSLAQIEGREAEAWATEPERQPTLGEPAHEALKAYDPEIAMRVSPSARRCAELARAHRTGQPAPEYRDIPEVA